jgi:hypothetical protein
VGPAAALPLPEEWISPELALVDPELARRARALLTEPESTLERLDAARAASRIASAQRRLQALPPGEEPRRRRLRPTGSRSWAVAALGVTASLLIGASLAGVRVDLRGSPASAEGPAVELPRAPSPTGTTGADRTAPTGSRRSRTTVTARQPHRFAWAPAAGASSYHFELFRGRSKVFEADTEGALATVPARWTQRGEPRSLEPGSYRWYVWPVAAGRRAAEAIVQADLTVARP